MTSDGPDFCTPEPAPSVPSTLENVEEWNPVEAGLAPPPPKPKNKEPVRPQRQLKDHAHANDNDVRDAAGDDDMTNLVVFFVSVKDYYC